jgi:DNA modification methylase
MRLEEVPVADLRPFEGNPRRISEQGLRDLRRSLRQFGWTNPVLAQRGTNMVIAGHQRLKAAQAEGIDRVPVVYLEMDDLTAKAYAVADNRLQEASEWVGDKLDALLEELRAEGFDVTLTGFSEADLEERIGAAEPAPGADDVPAVDPGPSATRRGDLWVLEGAKATHRVLCGDSTCEADALRLMAGEKAALVATDPPYLVDYTGADRPNGGKDWSAVYHEIDIPDAARFWSAALGAAMQVAAPDAPWYVWHAHRRVEDILAVWRTLGLLAHQQIIWVKPLAVFGRSYWAWQHEPCLFGWREGHRPAHDGDVSQKRTTVWRAGFQTRNEDGVPDCDVWEVDWEGKQRAVGNEHPTQKPVELFAIPMRKHTRPGDVCYEPFAGSGSQLIAGEMTGRRVYAMEIEPHFCDVAVRRWEALTGRRARREADGMSFEEALAAAKAAGKRADARGEGAPAGEAV